MLSIRVVDLETTGTTATDAAPVEIGAIDVIESACGSWAIDLDSKRDQLCNPSRKIPPEVSAIHHIIDSDVEGKPFWPKAIADCAGTDDEMFAPAIFCAHNARFERQWFTDEVTRDRPWICTYKCALRIWPDAPSHSNQALRYWLDPAGLDREIASVAHRAFPDAYVTAFILLELLKVESAATLIEISSGPALLSRVGFGKHFGKAWTEVDTSYLNWVIGQDFDEDVIYTAGVELERRAHEGRRRA